ncbi:MAG: hypothetical protein MJ244_01435 [Clostridia bacterium]|nr:hypothetical protein [Clostridia bacterium]
MEINNNINLNSIDKTYNVFVTDKNIIKENDKEEKNSLNEKTINNDINFNLNKIDNKVENEIPDINALLSSIKSGFENGANADIFKAQGTSNISNLFK